MTTSISNLIEKVISFFEKNRFNMLTLFIYLFLISALRMWSEAVILDYPYQELSYQYIFNHIHIIGFYFAVFLAGILILKFFTQEKLYKIVNLTGLGFLFILLPPILEIFVIGRENVYTYINPEKVAYLFNNFLTDMSNPSIGFFSGFGTFLSKIITDVVGYSLIIELVSVLLLTTIYVYFKTNDIKKTILNFFCFLGLMAYVATPNINPLIALWSKGESLVQPILILRYIILCIIFSILIMKLIKKGFAKIFLKSLRPFSNIHAIIMVFLGVLIAGKINIDFLNIFNPEYVGNIGTLSLSICSILFLWSYTLMLNHIYDLNIDKITNKDRILPQNYISITQAKHIAIIFLLIGLGLAYSLNIQIFLLAIAAAILGTLYSIPSIRIRNSMFSTSVIGLGSALAFYVGYFVPSYLKVNQTFPPEFARSTAELTVESGFIGIIIFILLSVSPLITDLKDIKGDKKAGVKSIFTVYGRKKGVKITSVLLFIAFISPLLLFHRTYDLIFFIILGMIMSIIYYQYHEKKIIFIPYLPLLIYCLLRWYSFF